MLILDKPASKLDGEKEFRHEPLPHSITHIRLLEVQPQLDTRDDTIRCRLRCVRLTEYDQCYTALSYTWNHDGESRSIFINGHQVGIKSNLYTILQLYRRKLMLHALPTVFIWVDALCLDYTNIRERNSQVQIMPNIFQRARTVLAWLEPVLDKADILARPPDLQSFVKFLGEVKSDLNRSRNFQNDRYLCAKYIEGSETSSCRYANEWLTMLRICRHDYWSRLWILQENRFAQNLMFLLDDTLWSWQEFRAPFVLMWYLVEWQLQDSVLPTGVDPAQILETPAADIIRSRLVFEQAEKFSPTSHGARSSFRYGDTATEHWHLLSFKEPLSDLLIRHKGRQCSERLDKVYALVGLSDSCLTVDYNRTNIELFCAVLLSLQLSLELDFVSTLAHHLDVSAFQYDQNRQSIIKNVLSTKVDQTAATLIGRTCHTVYSVKAIPARTEISDILQARLGIQNLEYFCITAQQNINDMERWDDFPPISGEMPRIHGYKPGTQMPIVDGFDLSDTSFRAAMFLNPTSRKSHKPVFGVVSTDCISDGDILVTEDTRHTGIIIRISGLRKTWLTVVGVALFARRVTVESELLDPTGHSGSPTNTSRSATLSDFCEHHGPTPFTVTGCDDREHFTLMPHDIQLARLSSAAGMANSRHSGKHSRSSSKHSNTTATTKVTPAPHTKKGNKTTVSKANRFARMLDILRSF